jgi:hypothetical protein
VEGLNLNAQGGAIRLDRRAQDLWDATPEELKPPERQARLAVLNEVRHARTVISANDTWLKHPSMQPGTGVHLADVEAARLVQG